MEAIIENEAKQVMEFAAKRAEKLGRNDFFTSQVLFAAARKFREEVKEKEDESN